MQVCLAVVVLSEEIECSIGADGFGGSGFEIASIVGVLVSSFLLFCAWVGADGADEAIVCRFGCFRYGCTE